MIRTAPGTVFFYWAGGGAGLTRLAGMGLRWKSYPDPFDSDLEGIPLGLKIRSDPIRSIRSDPDLKSSWAVLGLSLKSSWAVRPSVCPIRPGIRVLGPSWGRLGASWWRLGGVLTVFWTVLPSKMVPEHLCPIRPSARDRLEIWMPLGIGILSDLINLLVPK